MKNNYFYNENEQEFAISLNPAKADEPAPEEPKEEPTDPIKTGGESGGNGGDN